MKNYLVSISDDAKAEEFLALMKGFPYAEVSEQEEKSSSSEMARFYREQLLDIINQKKIPNIKPNANEKCPLFILEQDEETVTAFKIATHCGDFKITEWQQAGLDEQSYVDTSNTITLPVSSVDFENQIGKLTNFDTHGLIEFLEK